MRTSRGEWIAGEIATVVIGLALISVIVMPLSAAWTFLLIYAILLSNLGWAIVVARVMQPTQLPWWYRVASPMELSCLMAGVGCFVIVLLEQAHQQMAGLVIVLLPCALALVTQLLVRWVQSWV